MRPNTPLENPKISIVTAVYNRATTIESAIQSVLAQSWTNIEYIVIDGMSNDGTDKVIAKYKDQISQSVREPDDGIYDALNKGIAMASGEVVGFLHADDLLANSNVIEQIATTFVDEQCDAVYGSLLYVDFENADKIVRYWNSGRYRLSRFYRGWMPPHPTCYIRKSCYDRYGSYNRTMSIAADYELLVRMMVKHRIQVSYLPEILVKMRVGGKSNASMRNRLIANREDAEAWRVNDLRAPWGLRFMKPARKLLQYLSRPPRPK
ncbi:MAG: glycosyltransferase family 2 protein [Pirellulaceae bacterium]